jgi:transposase
VVKVAVPFFGDQTEHLRYSARMAMGKRKKKLRQSTIWIATNDLPRTAAHPFYERINRILDQAEFDAHVEKLCEPFYAERMGRPSLAPGRYFRLLLIGYFEGLDSERAIAWRSADSFSLRQFLDLENARGAARSFDDLAHAAVD